jgi:peptidoglycan/LPS O-acetylase OafA/YrhL
MSDSCIPASPRGCAATILTRAPQVRKIAISWIGAVIAIAFIAATLEWQPAIYSLIGAALLSIPFIVFASGNTMFGLLTCRPARLLGMLSYSIYLLHNWVLYLVSRCVNHYSSISYLPAHSYWMVGALVAMLTIACAALTYRFVEYPFLRTDNRKELELTHPSGIATE